MLVADIDHFKNVNDTYGHDVGDAVLKEFSVRLRRNTRGIDLACRLGGEEFVIIMPDTDLTHAYQVGERLRACVASDEFAIGDGRSIRVTASVGIGTLESLRRHARRRCSSEPITRSISPKGAGEIGSSPMRRSCRLSGQTGRCRCAIAPSNVLRRCRTLSLIIRIFSGIYRLSDTSPLQSNSLRSRHSKAVVAFCTVFWHQFADQRGDN